MGSLLDEVNKATAEKQGSAGGPSADKGSIPELILPKSRDKKDWTKLFSDPRFDLDSFVELLGEDRGKKFRKAHGDKWSTMSPKDRRVAVINAATDNGFLEPYTEDEPVEETDKGGKDDKDDKGGKGEGAPETRDLKGPVNGVLAGYTGLTKGQVLNSRFQQFDKIQERIATLNRSSDYHDFSERHRLEKQLGDMAASIKQLTHVDPLAEEKRKEREERYGRSLGGYTKQVTGPNGETYKMVRNSYRSGDTDYFYTAPGSDQEIQMTGHIDEATGRKVTPWDEIREKYRENKDSSNREWSAIADKRAAQARQRLDERNKRQDKLLGGAVEYAAYQMAEHDVAESEKQDGTELSEAARADAIRQAMDGYTVLGMSTKAGDATKFDAMYRRRFGRAFDPFSLSDKRRADPVYRLPRSPQSPEAPSKTWRPAPSVVHRPEDEYGYGNR